MVSFWPWSRDDSSTASFEKTLSALSSKISATQSRLDSMRSQSRRVRVLWTLYLTFAYLVYAIVVVLVVGSHKMGPYEWSTVAGGPVVIYVTRTTLAAYYNYRIESLSSRLKEQQTERADTIKKLKEATKYNSTLELLEKYGGAEGKPPQPQKHSADDGDDKHDADGRDGRARHGMEGRSNAEKPRRTNLPPPPTANIPRQQLSPVPGPPQPGSSEAIPPQTQSANSPNPVPVTEEFAPNAFSQSTPPPQAYARFESATEPHWYDRVLDLLLGEDEMAAKSRIVLICQECRLVNGQAPPGTKTLGDMGMWKCMSCGAMNGEIDEGKKIMQVLQAGGKGEPRRSDGPTHDGSAVELEEEEGGYQDEVEPGVVGEAIEKEKGKTSGARRRKGGK